MIQTVKEHAKFAFKVLIAWFIIRAAFDLLGSAGQGVWTFVNAPISYVKEMLSTKSNPQA